MMDFASQGWLINLIVVSLVVINEIVIKLIVISLVVIGAAARGAAALPGQRPQQRLRPAAGPHATPFSCMMPFKCSRCVHLVPALPAVCSYCA